MFKRQEAAQLREEFWTTFGKYMSPVPSADGLKINWVNYKTTFKDVYFRMGATNKAAIIYISLEHKDDAIRELYYQQFMELKKLLHQILGEVWIWQPMYYSSEQKPLSRIYKELPNVSIFNKEDWPSLISFFKPRIIKLDQFWADAQYSFEALR